jgi:hypothetical protein
MAALAASWETRRDIAEKMCRGCGGIPAVCNAELDKLSVQKSLPHFAQQWWVCRHPVRKVAKLS